MKKQITSKLLLSRETVRNLSERDLRGAVGGYSRDCQQPTVVSNCSPCPTDTCSDGSCGTAWCC